MGTIISSVKKAQGVNLTMNGIIKTLVYCDLEATGLRSSGRPRISELSLVAVNIEDILELHSQIKDISQNAQTELRVCFQEL